MKRQRIAGGLALALTIVGCGSAVNEPGDISGTAKSIVSPDEVWLAVGDEVRVDGLLRVGFTDVSADSRCPTSVTCVWQGDAAVVIHYGLGQGAAYPDTLHTALDPKSASFAGYRITLLEVGPYPSAPGRIPLDEYAIRIKVEHTAG